MCRKRESEHIDDFCPNGSGDKMLKHVQRVAASQSFDEKETKVLEYICKGLLAGKDVRRAAETKEFGKIYQKVLSMKRRIEVMKERKGIT